MVKVGMGIFKAGKYKNVYDNKENKLDDTSPPPIVKKKKKIWLITNLQYINFWIANESSKKIF